MIGAKPWIMLLCRFADTPLASLPTPASYQPLLATLQAYWAESSLGAYDLTGSSVSGWYDLPHPKVFYHGGPSGLLQSDLLSQDCLALADAGVDFSLYDGIIFQVSAPTQAGGGRTYYSLEGWVKEYGNVFIGQPNVAATYAHEMGHGVGLGHTHGWYGENYGSLFDVMGAGGLVHTSARNKELLGWISPTHSVTITGGQSRTVLQIVPHEGVAANTLPMIVRVPLPGQPGSANFYTIESRRRIGFDAALPWEGVLIHLVTPPNPFGGDFRIVDGDLNGNTLDDGTVFVPGERWVDSANKVTISVDSSTSTGDWVTIDAQQSPIVHNLTVTVVGSGAVVGQMGDCDSTCVYPVVDGQAIALGYSAVTPGFAFSGWSGACNGLNAVCSFTVTADAQVTATFGVAYPLTVTVNGSGTVNDSRLAIDCRGLFRGSCFANISPGSFVSLLATPDSGFVLDQFGGACAGQGPCAFQMSGPAAVSAGFVAALSVALSASSRRDSVLMGSTVGGPDSVTVALVGAGSGTAAWIATHGVAPWLTVITVAGTGTGPLRWTRDPTGLPLGTYVDTITVSAAGALGSPARLIDTLHIVVPAMALAASHRRDSTTLGSTVMRKDSVALTFSGLGSAQATWAVTHGPAPWLTVTTAAGTGSGRVRWTRNPTGLAVGTVVDTITIVAAGALGGPLQIIDSLRIFEPAVAASCGITNLFGGACLSPTERTYLDDTGNRDGNYNLGDLLAFLDRKGLPLSPPVLELMAAADSTRRAPRGRGRP